METTKKLKPADKVVQAKKKQVKKVKAAKKIETGVIYVGRLPYGFVEEGLKGYFEQYGDINKVKVMRSKKTARSKGYAFIEFADREVAQIAAQSMNGYMMYGMPLVVRILTKEEEHENLFIRSNKKFKFVPWFLIYKNQMNREKTDEQVVNNLKNLLQGDQKKKERLQELGINFNFPMYKDC